MRNHNYTDKNTGQKVYDMQNQVMQFRIYKSSSSSQKTVERQDVMDKDLLPYPDFSRNEFEYVEG